MDQLEGELRIRLTILWIQQHEVVAFPLVCIGHV